MGTSLRLPSLNTAQDCPSRSLSDSKTFSALYSWTNPVTAANTTIRPIATASTTSPNSAEADIARSRMTIRAFLNCPRKICNAPTLLSWLKEFGPFSASLLWASASERPFTASLERESSACSAETACQGFELTPSSQSRCRRYFRVEVLVLHRGNGRSSGIPLSTPIEFLQGLASQYGYSGIFLISVLGSAIPFVPLPYLAIVVLMSGTLNPLLLGVVAGVGAALGKVTSYALGRLGYLAAGDNTKSNLNAIQGVLARYGMWGVFIFAVTPLPDDVYVIPMGIARLPFWRFFVADLAGKILLSVLVAYFGRAYFSAADVFYGAESLPVLIVAVVGTAALSVLIARSDWTLAIETFRAGGLRGVGMNLGRILRLRKADGKSSHRD